MSKERSTEMMRDLTGGSVAAQLFKFAMPLFAANALQAVYNMVDMIVVGQVIGGAGMSAVSIGGDVLHLITFLAMGFSSAGQVLISQLVGARRKDSISKMIGTMFSFLLMTGLVVSILCFLLRGQILRILHTPAESYDYAMQYLVTCIVGLLFIYGYNMVSAVLRGMGDSKRPFLFIAIAAILNTILDILLVAVLRMDVLGAALATVIAQGTSFVIAVIYLYRKRESFGFDFKPSSFIISRDAMLPLLKLGIPMAIQSMAINISRVVLTSWINSEGVVYSALSGIYNKTGTVTSIISNSFTAAGSAMVGQSIGAGKYERVPKAFRVVLTTTASISTVLAILVFMFPMALCSLFTSDAEVLRVSSAIILPLILSMYGAATRAGAFSIINGSGNSRLNILVAVIDGMFGRIGLAALFGFALGMRAKGFWLGDALAGFIPFCIGGTFFLSGKWKRSAI